MTNACKQAELLAGAIALGEATDLERERYRRHVAACSACLEELGGEREIERVMRTISDAREAETWEPVLSSVQSRKRRRAVWAFRFALPIAAIAIAASAGIHSLATSNARTVAVAPAQPAAVSNASVPHVAVQHRAAPHAAKPPQAQPQQQVQSQPPRMFVVHNVITLKAPETSVAHVAANHQPVQNPAAAETKTTTVIAQTPVWRAAESSDVPIWRRDGDPTRRPRATTLSAPPPTLAARAESIAMSPVNTVRDVVPYGGETAINPEPPMIAYQEGAEGTTAFEVNVDERGMPVKCTITKSSGFLVLDNAVCRAAMKARFSPRMVNGRVVPGVYRDAFTFRSSVNNEGIQPPQ